MHIPREVVVCCTMPRIVIAIFALLGGDHLKEVWSVSCQPG
jgi:hypothetical protein